MKYKATTSIKIAEAIAERGMVTADDLSDLFPGKSREYICKALSNANQQGYIQLVRKGSSSHSKRVPGLWGPVTEEKQEGHVCSVWDLASPKVGLVKGAGRVVSPLGGWD